MNMCRFESLGVYLPEKTISNSESIDQVNVKGEDAHPLTLKAAEECLSKSQYEAKDLDAIIFTSNTHFKNELTFNLEPSMSAHLKQKLGLKPEAMTFDITNACASMVTGIVTLNQLIEQGVIRNGIVISGEIVTSLSETAIEDAITVEDSAVAVIIDESLDEYANLYYGLPNIDNSSALKKLPSSLGAIVEKSEMTASTFDFVIPHQASHRAIESALALCEEAFGTLPETCGALNKSDNISSTSNFIALDDYLNQGLNKKGDRVQMLILASGMILGAASVSKGMLNDYNNNLTHYNNHNNGKG